MKYLAIENGLICSNNQGSVWFENCNISVPAESAIKSDIIDIDNCNSIAFTDCSWFQLDSSFSPFSGLFGGGQIGMNVDQSEVHLFDCLGSGARGGSTGGSGTDGLPGGVALALAASTVNLSGTNLTGGSGGPGLNTTTVCGNGGDGAAAIAVNDMSSLVRNFDSTLQGGLGGPIDLNVGGPFNPVCVEGLDAVAIDGPGAADVVVIPGFRRSARFTGTGILPEGQPASLVLEGQPFDLVFWAVGVAQDHVYFPTFNGSSLITPLKLFKLGFLSAAGKKTVPLVPGDVTIPGQAINLVTQGYFFDLSSDAFVSSPSAVVIVDTSSDFIDGCATTIFVDDDAPGDPGPGDSDVSDPLEDGTVLRPFDSVQEALSSVILIGTVIEMADGLYQGTGNVDINPVTGTHVRIQSANGPDNCHVFVGGGNRGFVFDNATDVRADGLSGVRITGATNSGLALLSTTATIDNCVIEGNSASNGGGIFITVGSPLIQNTFIRSNLATNKGGGVNSVNASPEFRNCQITNNAGIVSGGGINFGGSLSMKIHNSTVAHNSGGGINFQSSVGTTLPLEVFNCNIWGNTLEPQIEFLFGELQIPYSNVMGGLAGIVNVAGTLNAGPGLIDVDPLFVNPAGFDYHLSPGSPCEDAGDPSYVPLLGETDIDGEARVQGVAIDLGSDEL
ncbi:MAG: hypothetical protein ACI8TQ_002595 [Planctomycetota bacterium]